MKSDLFVLNAKEWNHITYLIDVNTTGFDVIFRLKKNVENTTVPLVEVTAIKATEGTSSSGYWSIDLKTDPDLASLQGAFVYEIELNDNVTPPVFYGKTPQRCILQVRLDNN